MVKYKRYECLNHPVVEKFLDEKWNSSRARIWYISNIVLYAAFLFSLTGYIGIQRRGNYTQLYLPGGTYIINKYILFCFNNIVEQ